MPERVITYECPIAGVEHGLPGEHVRVLRTGTGGFIVACDCGPEALADADTRPHPTVDHLVNIYIDDPSPAEWLRLDDAADGWYAVSAWDIPEAGEGTWGQRRADFRERVEDAADTADGRDLEETPADEEAREVACPSCGAVAGRKCQRPSGHRVRKPHATRVEAVQADGESTMELAQAELSGWA